MAVTKGVDIVVFANTGTDGSPVWTAVGGQRNATLHEENETIDITSKDSTNGREFEYSWSSWTISCDGIFIATDTAYTTLQTAMRAKTKLKVRVKNGASYITEGQCLITSRDLEAPYEGEATYKMELRGTGALTANPS